MKVSRLQDRLGAMVQRRPAAFLKIGALETSWYAGRLEGIPIDRPIYITGLARSGTTILLEIIARHPATVTHQYRDFPFLFFPVWWNWFLERAGQAAHEAVERSHKDRILVTPRSPEAMEEMLWMAFFPETHAFGSSNELTEDTKNPAFEAFYRDHIRKLLLARGGTRYVAKGNYNISRMGYIAAMFGGARFIIPVREPVAHIASLMKQHRLFVDEERRDARVLDYMRRVGHFEFGLDRRPMGLGDGSAERRVVELWDRGEEVRGWAAHWAAVYGYAAARLESDPEIAERALVVSYENLCRSPAEVLAKIYAHCELEIDPQNLAGQAGQLAAPTYYSPDFTSDELALIEAETAETVARIGNLAV